MSGLLARSWILISASAFDLLQNTVLVEVFEETLDSHRYAIGKGRSSMAFLDTVEILLGCHTKIQHVVVPEGLFAPWNVKACQQTIYTALTPNVLAYLVF